ncbi:MAG: hypothetical protein WCL51_16945 [Bacteroidota bacterium]
MKKIIVVLLMLVSISGFSQNTICDYLITDSTEEIYIKCDIIGVSKNYVVYNLIGSYENLTLSLKAIQGIYFADLNKKCKLIPDSCGKPNPEINISIYRQNKERNNYATNNDVIDNFLIYNVPKNKIDSLFIDISFTKQCLNNYRKEQLTGIALGFIGTVTSGCGMLINPVITGSGKYTSEDYSMRYIAFGIGGGLALSGIIVFIDSYKWLKKSNGYPILEPFQNGVCIRF